MKKIIITIFFLSLLFTSLASSAKEGSIGDNQLCFNLIFTLLQNSLLKVNLNKEIWQQRGTGKGEDEILRESTRKILKTVNSWPCVDNNPPSDK
jgi:hypothetical protein